MWSALGVSILLLGLGYGQNFQAENDLFPVSIIHFNDFHARFEETNTGSTSCNREVQECIGGYARVVTKVKELHETRKDLNPIYLNAGDNFQGTFWYNFFQWNVTSYFLNLLPADAMAIGNHEFDHNIEGIVPFLENSLSPIVVCNIDVTNEPTMAGLYTNSVKIQRSGKTIGVIGVILSTTHQIASTRDLIFLDEVESITAEAQKLRMENVDMIIVLSHCGIEVDRRIARETGDLVDVIVGGHSHTFLFTGNDPPGPDRPQDEYPIVVKNNDHTVLIVQASAYTKYLGDIVVYFDDAGEIVSWDGAPIYLDSSVIPDPDIVREMEPWHAELEAEQNRIVGRTTVFLSTFGCSSDECNIGSLITDAFVDAYIDYARSLEDWTYATIAITNVGGIRTSLNQGSLVFGDLVAAIPFENTLNVIDLKGDKLIETLEFGASESWEEDYFRGKGFLQHSGMKVVYNVTNPPFERVIEAKALCQTCEEPTYEDIQADRMYRVILPSFLNGGGDGFDVLRDFGENKIVGFIDIDAFQGYVTKMSPITQTKDGRLKVVY